MTLVQTRELLESCILANDSLLMEGSHGIGKSAIPEQYCKDNNIHLETLFLSNQEVGDLIGMPQEIEIQNEKILTWTKPVWLKRMEEASEEGKRTMLFLDELNRAELDVRQAALELILSKRIHEHKLPETNGEPAIICAAINPVEDGDYQVQALDVALLDRFMHCYVEPDVTTWLDWAKKNDVPQVIRTFISENPDKLNFKGKENAKGATPRGWAKMGEHLKDSLENNNLSDILFYIIEGKIGTSLATLFTPYVQEWVKKDVKDRINAESIMECVRNLKDKNDVQVMQEAVQEHIESLESIRLSDLLNTMRDEYMNDKGTEEEKFAYLALLYGAPLEIKLTHLRNTREQFDDMYQMLVEMDEKYNDKGLFRSITRMQSENEKRLQKES